MKDSIFIDTNLWIYLYSNEEKGNKIKQLVDDNFINITVSTQVLGEIFHTITRKGFKDKEDAKQIVLSLSKSFNIFEILYPCIVRAIDICVNYGYSYWDSLIVAASLESNCSILYTEDMHHGQAIEDRLRIINPFVKNIVDKK